MKSIEGKTRYVTRLEKAMADANKIRIVRSDGTDHAHEAATYPPAAANNATTQDGLYDELLHELRVHIFRRTSAVDR